jgi:hypothetical protein
MQEQLERVVLQMYKAGVRLSLVTMPSGFAINSIGIQLPIRSAITLPPCLTFFGSGSGLYFAYFGTVAT